MPKMRTSTVVLLLLLLLAGCQSAEQVESDPPALSAVVDEVTPAVSAEGEIVPARVAHLSSPVGGRVVELLVNEGERVKANAPLVRFDAASSEANIAQAEAELARAAARDERETPDHFRWCLPLWLSTSTWIDTKTTWCLEVSR